MSEERCVCGHDREHHVHDGWTENDICLGAGQECMCEGYEERLT